MDVNVKANKNSTFDAKYLFFIVISMQVGLGITSFSNAIFKEAGHDGWISVIIAGLFTHLVIYTIIKTLENYQSADIYGVNYNVFGKWIGSIFSSVYIIYSLGLIIVMFYGYIEIIQTWLFPQIPNWLFNLIGVILIIYGVTGGLRVLVGLSLFVFISTSWMILLYYYPLQYAEWRTLLPLMDNPFKKIFSGAYQMTFSLAGFEILYVIYPYISNKKNIQLYSQLGALFTNLLYTFTMIVSIVYFSPEQIINTIWPTLSFFKVVRFPFIERFEYIAISLWMLVILPAILLYAWAGTSGIKRVFGLKQRYALYLFAFLIFLSSFFVKGHDQILIVSQSFSKLTVYQAFIYPLILFLLVIIKKKYIRRKGRRASE